MDIFQSKLGSMRVVDRRAIARVPCPGAAGRSVRLFRARTNNRQMISLVAGWSRPIHRSTGRGQQRVPGPLQPQPPMPSKTPIHIARPVAASIDSPCPRPPALVLDEWARRGPVAGALTCVLPKVLSERETFRRRRPRSHFWRRSSFFFVLVLCPGLCALVHCGFLQFFGVEGSQSGRTLSLHPKILALLLAAR